LFKAYLLIWESCAKTLQNKLMSRPDCENKLYNNPFELVKALKLHAMHLQETRYEMSILANIMRAMMNTQQKDRESFQNYT
jgi:hypothetical protein